MVKYLFRKIRALRENSGFSQEYMAGELGMSRPTYTQIEKGERDVTITEVKKLADVFGISLNNLLEGRKAKAPKVILEKIRRRRTALWRFV